MLKFVNLGYEEEILFDYWSCYLYIYIYYITLLAPVRCDALVTEYFKIADISSENETEVFRSLTLQETIKSYNCDFISSKEITPNILSESGKEMLIEINERNLFGTKDFRYYELGLKCNDESKISSIIDFISHQKTQNIKNITVQPIKLIFARLYDELFVYRVGLGGCESLPIRIRHTVDPTVNDILEEQFWQEYSDIYKNLNR